MKLLCAADLHLGRQPSRVPGHLEDLADRLTPAESWRRLVALAKAEGVTAVLLAGDVVEDEHDFFEAFADLRSGAEELAAAGIALVAVAGNHDVAVLPRLAQAVPSVRVLGAGGHWEALPLGSGGTRVNVVGWSWPAKQVTASPLDGLAEALAALVPAPTLGLLHCDLDRSRSAYAPVSRAALSAAQVDAWLLGHGHKPSFEVGAGDRWCGYRGSAFGAAPGEEGPRGAWLLTVGDAGLAVAPVPLSPLLFDTVSIDVSSLAAADEVSAAVVAALEAHGRALADLGDVRPLAVGVRLRVVGRHDMRAAIATHLEQEDPRELDLTAGGARYFVHDVSFEVYPRIDVAAVAASEGPRALMARRLLLLGGPACDERTALIDGAREAMLEAARHSDYGGLEPPDLSDDAVVAALRRAAARLLSQMTETRP